jgi:hypothetical protein
MKDNNFPWFEKVSTLKCYSVSGLKDPQILQTWFTKFRNLKTFKGIITEEFNPLGMFQEEQKHIPELSWTLKDKDDKLRQNTLDFF